MEIHWTRHAIHRCWERMLLDDDEKNMGIFDEAIRNNLDNMVVTHKGLCIPFKVKNQKYYVSVKKEKDYLVIVTMFHLNRTGWLTEALLDN
jgi:hypothetical protein